MEFSPTDEDLVEIIEAVGEVALAKHNGKLTPDEGKEKEWYIDLLVKRYICNYGQGVPSKSRFTEAVNWHVDNNLSQRTLADAVKNIMRDLVLGPYNKYRELYYKGRLDFITR